jgi:myosin protein heavy chain
LQVLERHLAAAQAKYQDFEDVVLQLERDKGTQDRQVEAIRKQLEAEFTKRSQLEHMSSSQRAELVKIKDRNVKLDRDLNKALSDLKAREWEVKQLEGRQDKTIVEHVHVLEEAKRVTDRQLAETRTELENTRAYIRSLEKAKSRLAGEAEDLVRETERERVELRTKERTAKAQEERAAKALADVERERRAREAAEGLSRKLHADLQNAHNQVLKLSEQLAVTQLSKDQLEAELTRLADDFDAPTSMARMQRGYETTIRELRSQLDEAESFKTSATRIKQHIDRQHAEIRQLIKDSPGDDHFQARLLRELQLADEQLDKEINAHKLQPKARQAKDIDPVSKIGPNTRSVGVSQRAREERRVESSKASDNQINALRQQVQVLELQLAASDRVRRHLETSIRDMTADLENSDGSKQFLQQYRARLSKENARLAELLEDEANARRTAETAQIDGVRQMWDKFQSTMSEEREHYSQLEESRRALVSYIIVVLDS